MKCDYAIVRRRLCVAGGGDDDGRGDGGVQPVGLRVMVAAVVSCCAGPCQTINRAGHAEEGDPERECHIKAYASVGWLIINIYGALDGAMAGDLDF